MATMKVPNRRSDDRRPSARFFPAAAEPLLVIDSPPQRSRSGSRNNIHDVNVAAVAPSEGGPINPHGIGPDDSKGPFKRTLSTRSSTKDYYDDEDNKGLIASLKSYPKGVFFMLGNEFCERFSFYGMRAVLIMYFKYQHNYDESTAKTLYHGFVSLAYLSPLIGSIAADNYFGRFKVILWVSLLYVLGHALLSFGALPTFGYAIQTAFDFSGLIIIALATGGIKPCVSAFAADQFDEHQHRQRAQFFSFFYFSINAGSLVAIMLTPLLRGRVSCFGSPYCFPLAFGVPGVLMLMAFVIFLFGWRFYKITPAGKGNIVFKVVKCIGFAMKGKISAVLKRQDKAPHWIDYASSKYPESLITGVKSLLAVSALFIPIVFFWALFDQQGSTWVIQASQMDGRVGPITILPDQMNTFNPLIILIMVPIFEAFIYPFTRKFVEITPLRKMAAGGILAALAFLMAGLLQLRINATLETFPNSGNIYIQKFGNINNIKLNDTIELINDKNEINSGIYYYNDQKLDFSKNRGSYILAVNDDEKITTFPYKLEKASGQTNIIVVTDDNVNINGKIIIVDYHNNIYSTKNIRNKEIISIQPPIISSSDYQIYYGENCNPSNYTNCEFKMDFVAKIGAVHAFYIPTGKTGEMRRVVQENSVNILWQLPQFFVITLGEVLFSVTGLEFSYSQASPNMKSVLQAMWLLTTFAGNVIDMGVSGARVFHEQSLEFFFYSLLMFIVVGIFIIMAINYQYVDEELLEQADDEVNHIEDETNKTEKKPALDSNC